MNNKTSNSNIYCLVSKIETIYIIKKLLINLVLINDDIKRKIL
jgi:hypothetical protein